MNEGLIVKHIFLFSSIIYNSSTYKGFGGSLASNVPSFLALFPPASSRSSSLSLSTDKACKKRNIFELT